MRIRKQTEENLIQDENRIIAAVSDGLAHPARVAIFKYIYHENLEMRTVCNKTLVEKFPYAQATISQHVAKLVQAGLLEVKPSGSSNHYFVNLGLVGKYLEAVRKM